MEVNNGFIVGIFNYCDRWCETCAFTSRCRLFADSALHEASCDPSLKPVVDAPLLPQDLPPPPARWLLELIDAMHEALTAPADDLDRLLERRERAAEKEPVYERAMAYCRRVHEWRARQGDAASWHPPDARAVIEWFHTLVPGKIGRALRGRAADDPADREWPADHEGSAKVALDGIDRTIAAWEELGTSGVVPLEEAHAFIVDLMWQRDELERLFPKARAFVRPGFDEPDEVAKLLAED